MTKQMDIFSVARARRTDPGTSHDAARSIHDMTETQRGVYFFLKRSPGTDEQLETAYYDGCERFGFPMASPQGLRSRRAELVALGWVEDSGESRETKYGGKSIVWRVK